MYAYTYITLRWYKFKNTNVKVIRRYSRNFKSSNLQYFAFVSVAYQHLRAAPGCDCVSIRLQVFNNVIVTNFTEWIQSSTNKWMVDKTQMGKSLTALATRPGTERYGTSAALSESSWSRSQRCQI